MDITQALLSHELDFAFIDSNTVFDDRLTVCPALGAVSAAVAAGQPLPGGGGPASLDVAEELLVTWDPEFIRWHDRWFGTGARPLLYADTLQAADFLPPAEGPLGGGTGHRRRVAHRKERTGMPLYQPAA